jgi:hypothetical protein
MGRRGARAVFDGSGEGDHLRGHQASMEGVAGSMARMAWAVPCPDRRRTGVIRDPLGLRWKGMVGWGAWRGGRGHEHGAGGDDGGASAETFLGSSYGITARIWWR